MNACVHADMHLFRNPTRNDGLSRDPTASLLLSLAISKYRRRNNLQAGVNQSIRHHGATQRPDHGQETGPKPERVGSWKFK